MSPRASTAPESYPELKVIGAKAAEVVAALRAESGEREIWLFGGGQLFSSLSAAGQEDAVEVTVVPVPLGGRVPLVAGIARTEHRLRDTHRYASGMVSLVDHVAPSAISAAHAAR